MNDYEKLIVNCVNLIDAQIESPLFSGKTLLDFEDLIRKYYEQIQTSLKVFPSYEDFYKTIEDHFRKDEPPPVIKEFNIGGWLDTALRSITPLHWNFYKKMLIADGKSNMLPYLDSDTFSILDSCMDPREGGLWDRRGLVYGHIQSGKTANYIGLITKAFDAGYRVVILFTGMTEDLRKQTQDRINEGVIGRDKNNNAYGVGKFSGFPFGIKKGTTLVADLSKSTLPPQIANLSLNDKIVFVIKKNVTILNNLITWLRNKSQEQKGNSYKIKNTPFLVIDDEADNASIKSLSQNEYDSGEYDLKSINRNIRIILSLIEQKTFVAYTATPYSVVLQRSEDKERTWQIKGEEYIIDENSDLFPEHFIIPIRHGANYFGIERVFGNTFEPGLPVVTQIDADKRFKDNIFPDGGFFSTGINTVYDFPRIPDSLQIAILHYVVAIIVRRFRNQDDYNTMLVHTSHKIDKIDYLANRISEHLSLIQNMVLYDPLIADLCNKELDFIRSNSDDLRFREYFGAGNAYELPEIISKEEIHNVLREIDLVSYHSRDNDPRLKHKNHILRYDLDKKKDYIVVGGNRLSRGLTILGLSTSYFVRYASRKDSLYQMGRWFGYRKGFEDCIQIYTNSDLFRWFQDIMDLEEKLRRDIDNMNSQDEMTPSNWEIKVARSLLRDSRNKELLISDPNKLRNAAQRRMAFGGRTIRTKYFDRDEAVQKKNLVLALNFISSLIDNKEYTVGNTVYPDNDPNLNFINVPYRSVIRFLQRFSFHTNQEQDFSDLVFYLNEHGDKLDSFSVVLKQLKRKSKKYPDIGFEISPIHRVDKRRGEGDYYEIDALIDSDKDNTFDIIDENNKVQYENSAAEKSSLLYKLRNKSKKAILIIYTVEGEEAENGGLGLFPSIYLLIPAVGEKENYLIRN